MESMEGSQAGDEQPKNVLKLDTILPALSMIDKTVDGSSYAYVKLILEEKEIEELGDDLENFQHLRFLSLAKNALKDIYAVSKLPHLLTLNASQNKIENTIFLGESGVLLFLQQANLANNKIQALKPVRAPCIKTLNLNDNQIATAQDFGGHETLQVLELRNNKLTSLAGIRLSPQLRELYLEGNQLTSLQGLEALPQLTKLDVKGNQIVQLNEVPVLPALADLDLGGNQLEGLKELEKLKTLNKLRNLNVGGNESLDGLGDGIKKEVLIVLMGLKLQKVNDDEVTEEDVAEAKEEKANRIKAEEEEREAQRLKEQEAKEEEPE